MANFLETTFLTQLRNIPDFKNQKYLIAYSAGADSTAVLAVASHIMKKLHIPFDVVFFSHENCKLNEGESDNLELAQKTCHSLGLSLIHQPLDMSNKGNYSLEQYGRMLRHEFYQSHGYDIIMMGHHKDDQNETTMIQLFRGAGSGTQGMKVLDQHFFRPFLNFRKKELISYLVERNIEWLDDPTNKNNDMTRNFWRNVGLPAIEKHYSHYSSALDVVREKFAEQDEMAYELALSDNLEEFLSQSNCKKPSTPLRTSNLIIQYLKQKNISCEPQKIKKTVQENFHKTFTMIFSDISIVINKDKLQSSLSLVNQDKKSLKN